MTQEFRIKTFLLLIALSLTIIVTGCGGVSDLTALTLNLDHKYVSENMIKTNDATMPRTDLHVYNRGEEIIFTANSEAGYYVEKWIIKDAFGKPLYTKTDQKFSLKIIQSHEVEVELGCLKDSVCINTHKCENYKCVPK